MQPGEPSGQWLGQGSAQLGLSGCINRADFLALFDGFAPNGQALLFNAGQENHCPGWDLTFSAVKSVGGLLWAVSPPHIQAAIESCHQRAVQKAIAYLEAQSINRDGAASRLVIAAFQHGSNRNLDPGLHTHGLVLNLAVSMDREGQPRPVDSRPLYQHKRAAGAVYRSELSYLLQHELGLSLERVQSWFELTGFSRAHGRHQALMNRWSSRRQEIETEGPVSAQHAQLLAYQTRSDKGTVPPRHELFQSWQRIAADDGWTQTKAMRLVKSPQHRTVLGQKWAEWRVTREAATAAVRHQSHFTHRDWVQAMAEAAQTRHLSTERVMELAERYLASRYVIRLGIIDGHCRYANKRLYRLEQKLLKQAQTLAQSRGFRVRQKTVTHAVTRDGLHPEQEQGVVSVTHPSRLSVMTGLTGTGKTYTLRSLRQIYRNSGYEVLTVAASRRGMEKLQEQMGLKNPSRWAKQLWGASDQAMSVYQLIAAIDRAKESQWRYGSRSVVHSPLSTRTVVMVDDAQRINTAQLQRLVKEVSRAGAKLILCGDLKQHQSYDHRGAFAAIAQRIGHVALKQGIRQQEEKEHTLVQQVSQGHTRAVVQTLLEQGTLTFVERKDQAMAQTVQRWRQHGIRHPRQHLMMTETSHDANLLNRLAQHARVEAGALSQVAVKVRGEHFYRGDRVRFRDSSDADGVTKGSLGTLKHLDLVSRMAVVRLDSGKTRLINTRRYRGLELGYAVTTTAAQDMKVNHAYVMMHGTGRESALVQLSRARKQTQVIAYGQHSEEGQEQSFAKQLRWSTLQELSVMAQERAEEEQERRRSP